MGPIEILLWFDGGAAPLLFAAGCEMIRRQRFSGARTCFYLSALCFSIGIIMWASTTDQPWQIRVIVTGIVGFVIIAGMSEAVRWGVKETMAQTSQPISPSSGGAQPTVNISGGDNVVSIGQIGGITAKIVTINPPLQPELRILGKSEVDNSDGSHTVTLRTEVASPITPGLLIIQIAAAGIRQVSIVPLAVNGVSMMQLRNVRRDQNSYSAEIPAPRGQYDLVIQTNSVVPISLNATF
jgi:hypothetical protein